MEAQELEKILSVYKNAQKLIQDSTNPKIKELSAYTQGSIKIEITNDDLMPWTTWETHRSTIQEPIEISIGHKYARFATDKNEPLAKTEMVFTALHEILENAQEIIKHDNKSCPKANALAGIILTGKTSESLRNYIHENWGLTSYIPTITRETGKTVIEFCKETSNEFKIMLTQAYIYLRTNTLLTYNTATEPEKAEWYTKEVENEQV